MASSKRDGETDPHVNSQVSRVVSVRTVGGREGLGTITETLNKDKNFLGALITFLCLL